jgi:tellurite resistance protein TehA-like permease
MAMTSRPAHHLLLKRGFDWASSAGGAQVMATGIVSLALDLDGQRALSTILLVLAAIAWAALAALVLMRMRSDRPRLLTDLTRPFSLTFVAGTAVVGAGLTARGWTAVGAVLLVIALAVWAILIVTVLSHWATPTTGVSLLVCVATESLAVLAATLALSDETRWLLVVSVCPFVLGLGLYVFVLARFDLRQLVAGPGDHWILGGALAIATLAGAKITAGARAFDVLGGGEGLKDLAVGLWAITMLWLPVLALAEVIRHRLYYDVRRWSTVFPLGMYAACSFEVGSVGQIGAGTRFAEVWTWVALLGWVTMAGATAAQGGQRGPHDELSSPEQTRWRRPQSGLD